MKNQQETVLFDTEKEEKYHYHAVTRRSGVKWLWWLEGTGLKTVSQGLNGRRGTLR